MTNPNLFFSTPVWVSKIDNYKETNEKIYHYIKNLHSADNKGIIKSNIKGWHSKDFNLNETEPQKFISFILVSLPVLLLAELFDFLLLSSCVEFLSFLPDNPA